MEGSARASTQIRTAPNLLVVYATWDVAFILQKYKWITFRQVLFSGNAHNLLISRSCITKNKNMQSIEEHSQRERSSYCRNLVNHLSRSWIHFSKRVQCNNTSDLRKWTYWFVNKFKRQKSRLKDVCNWPHRVFSRNNRFTQWGDKKGAEIGKTSFFYSLSLFCRNRHLLRNVNYIKCNFEDLLVLVKFISKYAFHFYEKWENRWDNSGHLLSLQLIA